MSRLQFVINFGMYTLSGRVRTMFTRGEVVRLKSGGPNMTVSEVEELSVHCVWFSTKGELNRDAFDPILLTKAKTSFEADV